MQFLRCLKFGFLTPCDRLIACSISPIRHGMIVICFYEDWIPLSDPGWDIIMKYISQWFFPCWKKNSRSIFLSLYVICPHAKYHMLSQILSLYMSYVPMSYFICHMVYNIYLILFICHMSPCHISYVIWYILYTIYHMTSHISYVICHIPYTCFSLYVICPHIIWHIPCYMTPKSNPTFLPKDRWNNLPLPNQLYEPRVSK